MQLLNIGELIKAEITGYTKKKEPEFNVQVVLCHKLKLVISVGVNLQDQGSIFILVDDFEPEVIGMIGPLAGKQAIVWSTADLVLAVGADALGGEDVGVGVGHHSGAGAAGA